MDLSNVLRIGRWEVFKGTDSLTGRTVVVALAALSLTAGLGVAVSSATVTPDAGIYVVGVDENSPYHDVATSDETFVVRDPDSGTLGEEFDLLIRESRVHPADNLKGQAALSEFRTAARRYNDRRLAANWNDSVTFPLIVRLEYVQREQLQIQPGGGSEDGDGGDGGDSSDGGTDGGGDGGGDGSTDGGDGTTSTDEGELSVPQVGGQQLFASSQTGTPSSISPPFPFGALLLAFAFVVPMNFVIQAYGATMLRERIDRQGELMLVSPVSPADIVAGKTSPYLLLTILVSVGIALYVGGGALSIAAVLPIALLFLASTFLASMFARSFKELTFLTVTISVGLTSYVFVPAIFTEVTPIALISPLTIVVRDLLGQGVTPAQYVFSTGPFYASAAVLFVLGLGTYREEDLFSQRPVHLKALDALATRLGGVRDVAIMTAAFIPFVLVAELLAVALLYALPLAVTIPLLFLTVALVEEFAKSIHVYAGFAHRQFASTDRVAVAMGVASGLGFFVGEKLMIIVQVVGLADLPVGRATFTSAASLSAGSALLLLFAPLLLHTTTASISSLGARRGSVWYAGTYLVAVVVHLLYNLGVVTLVA